MKNFKLGFLIVFGVLFLYSIAAAQASSRLDLNEPLSSFSESEAETIEGAAHDDEYWASLTADEEPLLITESMVEAQAASNVGGSWGPVISWPLNPVSVANLPDGRILTYSGSERYSWPRAEQTYSAIWDPKTGSFEERFHPSHNLFCAELVSLPDGRIFTNGGRNTVTRSSIFDWGTESWSRTDEMNSARWYPTSIALPDGGVFTAVGKNNRYPEVWHEGDGWTQLTGADLQGPILDYGSNKDGAGWWPLMHLDPRGDILHYGATPEMHGIGTDGNGSIWSLGESGFDWFPEESVAVQYDATRLLVAGGATSATQDGKVASNKAAIIDMSQPTPQIINVPGMIHARQHSNEVVLPNGEVLVMGGTTTGKKFTDSNSVLAPEVWNPETQTWRLMNPMSVPRNYHSTGILLPDGRVFSGGGGYVSSNANHPSNHPDVQIFSPPYLFNGDGSLATRPEIISAPDLSAPGFRFDVQTSEPISRFTMIRMSATTHTMNTGQRFLEVGFTGSGSDYSLTLKSNENILLPGYWMLFAINDSGVPSESKIIHIQDLEFIIDPIEDQESMVETAVSIPVNVNVKSGTALTFSATGLPEGVSINPTTGLISGTPTAWGYFDVNVTATSNSKSESVSFQWVVVDPDTEETRFDFETDQGWMRDPNGTDLATGGVWERGDPKRTDEDGILLQLGNTTSGNFALVTGAAAGQLDLYENDVDTGITSISSPEIDIPVATEGLLLLNYYFAHLADATGEDFLRIIIEGSESSDLIFATIGDGTLRPGQWESLQKDISNFSGQTIRIVVEAADNGAESLIEAAIDDVVLLITPITERPILTTPEDQASTLGNSTSLQINATDPDGDSITFFANGLPTGLSINAESGLVSGVPTEVGDFYVSISVEDPFKASDSGSFNWNVTAQPIVLSPFDPAPEVTGTAVEYAADAAGGGGTLRYKWSFGDGSPESGWSDSPNVSHVFENPGRYIVTLFVEDEYEQAESITFNQAIYTQKTEQEPNRSTGILVEKRNGPDRLWVANPDNDTVSVFSVATYGKLAEIEVGDEPHALALAPNGQMWVVNQASATLSRIDTETLSVVGTQTYTPGSEPYGLVFLPNGAGAFLAFEATGVVARLTPSTGTIINFKNVGSHPRHLAIDAAGENLYVTRFITPRLPGEETADVQTDGVGGEMLVLNPSSLAIEKTIVLAVDTVQDAELNGRGVPNYLGAPAISPDGSFAWIPSKEDNVLLGEQRDGEAQNFQHSVRAVSSVVDLGVQAEVAGARIDHDDSSLASAAQFGLNGNYLFVALETSREIAVVDAYQRGELFRVDTGLAPQGLALSSDGTLLFVHNFMDRTVRVYDLSDLIDDGIESITEIATLDLVADEALSDQILKGKTLFYDARDTRLALDSYMSCASCHNDGGQDGRIWDFTDSGEGLRNTISLVGRGGPEHGRLHWTGNFDEVHDFEGQIRAFSGGAGLMSDSQFEATNDPLGATKAGMSADLDAMAAYVNSLTTFGSSPYRNSDGSLTAEGETGRQVFRVAQCASCHTGDEFTDSGTNVLHDVGTLKTVSGSRMGQPLAGLDTPSLKGLWSTAPYLHDGSAATLNEAIEAHNGVDLTLAEIDQLATYLLQIDDNETNPGFAMPPTPTPIGTSTPTLVPTASPTFTPTPILPPKVCGELENGDFSAGLAGWNNQGSSMPKAGSVGDGASVIDGALMQLVPASPNEPFTLKVSYIVVGDLSTGWVGFGVDYFADGTEIGEVNQQIVETESQYVTVEIEGTTAAGTDEVQIWFYSSAELEFVVDEIEFSWQACVEPEPTPTATPTVGASPTATATPNPAGTQTPVPSGTPQPPFEADVVIYLPVITAQE